MLCTDDMTLRKFTIGTLRRYVMDHTMLEGVSLTEHMKRVAEQVEADTDITTRMRTDAAVVVLVEIDVARRRSDARLKDEQDANNRRKQEARDAARDAAYAEAVKVRNRVYAEEYAKRMRTA